jgi:hypothetical protein
VKNIHRVLKSADKPYVTVNKEFIKNNQLSWKAKGILLYLLSKPDDWQTYIEDIINHSTDGKVSVATGLVELKRLGYIKKVAVRNEKGQVTQWLTKVYEHPDLNEGVQ